MRLVELFHLSAALCFNCHKLCVRFQELLFKSIQLSLVQLDCPFEVNQRYLLRLPFECDNLPLALARCLAFPPLHRRIYTHHFNFDFFFTTFPGDISLKILFEKERLYLS